MIQFVSEVLYLAFLIFLSSITVFTVGHRLQDLPAAEHPKLVVARVSAKTSVCCQFSWGLPSGGGQSKPENKCLRGDFFCKLVREPQNDCLLGEVVQELALFGRGLAWSGPFGSA